MGTKILNFGNIGGFVCLRSVLVFGFSLVMVDEVYNLLASKFFNWPDAMDFYRSIGWKYLT